MKVLFRIAGLALSGALVATGAQAAPLTYNFTASDFTSMNGSPVPLSTVSGSVTLDGTLVTGIDLTIGTHSYSLADVEYQSWMPILGGKMSDFDSASSITWGTDDFHLWGDLTNPSGWFDFAYSVVGVNDYFDTFNVSVSESATLVPEPETFAMVMTGLGILGAFQRRRKFAA
jgi:hypothetical protein